MSWPKRSDSPLEPLTACARATDKATESGEVVIVVVVGLRRRRRRSWTESEMRGRRKKVLGLLDLVRDEAGSRSDIQVLFFPFVQLALAESKVVADKAQLRTSDTSNEEIRKVIGNIIKALRDDGQGEKVPGCQGLSVGHREKRVDLDCSVSLLRFPCLDAGGSCGTRLPKVRPARRGRHKEAVLPVYPPGCGARIVEQSAEGWSRERENKK